MTIYKYAEFLFCIVYIYQYNVNIYQSCIMRGSDICCYYVSP